jgi:hypothetical protein
MKVYIWVGLTLGGTVGGYIGALLSGGNWFSAASILLGAAGSLAGIWAGFKASQYL